MGHANTPPELPEITDEAGDSPKWLPWLGVGLFLVAALCVGLCHGKSAEAASTTDDTAEAATP